MKNRKSRYLFAFMLTLIAQAATGEEPRAEDVAFTAKCDGSTQHYVVVYPRGFQADQPVNVLVALHGHGADRWQFVKDTRDECKAARDAAAVRGMLFVSPDYRARTSWMGPKAEADMLQILEELKAKFNVGRVIVSGGSMGATSALTFAALHPEVVAGVVALNGTANHVEYQKFQDAIGESFGGTKAQVPQEYEKRSAELQAERLTMPVGITAGGKDDIVPPASVLRLGDKLKKMDRKVLVIYREACGHRTNYEDARAVFAYVLEQATR